MRLVAFAVASIVGLSVASAEDAKPTSPLTVVQALSMLMALKSLDGHEVVIKSKEGDQTKVVVPWELSGLLRLKIANDITVLQVVEGTAEKTRQGLLREATKDKPGPLTAGTPEYDEFIRQWSEVLNSPAPGSVDLARIAAADLKLDKNEIPVSVLSALMPILDQ